MNWDVGWGGGGGSTYLGAENLAMVRCGMSCIMRKPAFCIWENKGADQLQCNHTADQRICFRFIDSANPLLPKSEISSLWPSSVAIQ